MKFEYKLLTVDTLNLKKETFQFEIITKFNELGLLGWELINVEGIIDSTVFWKVGETKELLFVFKRVIT